MPCNNNEDQSNNNEVHSDNNEGTTMKGQYDEVTMQPACSAEKYS